MAPLLDQSIGSGTFQILHDSHRCVRERSVPAVVDAEGRSVNVCSDDDVGVGYDLIWVPVTETLILLIREVRQRVGVAACGDETPRPITVPLKCLVYFRLPR